MPGSGGLASLRSGQQHGRFGSYLALSRCRWSRADKTASAADGARKRRIEGGALSLDSGGTWLAAPQGHFAMMVAPAGPVSGAAGCLAGGVLLRR